VTNHHSQVLTATVNKPCPRYYEQPYLVYANNAAPDLIFSRQDSDAEHMTEKQVDKKVAKDIKKLSKKSEKSITKGENYTVLSNSEFEVLFGATNRNNEVQFRLLFTPLAQRELLAIMKEKAVQELVVSEPIFYLGFKDIVVDKLSGRDVMHREILMELVLDALFGTSEKLYNDLYKADLIDEGFGFEYAAETTYGYTMIGGETKDPDQLYDRIMSEIKKAQKNGISEEQFERHRRKILGSYIRKFDSLEFIANNFLTYRFRDTDLFELPGVLNEVTREEALALIEENLNPERHAVSLVLPSE